MAIVQDFGHLNLLISFIANPKLEKIEKKLYSS